jgi:hypothetical protein
MLDYEEAIQDFTMSIELDPHDEKAFNNLGVLIISCPITTQL